MARDWYQKILGQEPVYASPFLVHFKIGNDSLCLVPENESSLQSRKVVAYWETDDIDDTYQKMLEAGASPKGEVKMVAGMRAGSVVDPFGNVLGLNNKNFDAHSMSVENQPSVTALATASLRALGVYDEREEIRCRDHLAEIFLTDERKKQLTEPKTRAWIMQNAIPAGMYEALLVRTAYFDQIFNQALQADIPQIVLLGAGYDSRAYRFIHEVKDRKIYELDAKPTQERKLSLLQKHQVDIPKNLTFIPVNFNHDDFITVLQAHGYDRTQKTLFLWEGVTYYLSSEIIDQTLSKIVDNSPPGSLLVFDYQGLSEGQNGYQTATPGETIQFGIEECRIEEFLSKRGLKLIEDLAAGNLENRFLLLHDGTLAGHLSPHIHLAYASVCKNE